MDWLVGLLTAEDGAVTVGASGDDWMVVNALWDLGMELITIQRRADLIAAITPSDEVEFAHITWKSIGDAQQNCTGLPKQ